MPFSGSLIVVGHFNFWILVIIGTLGNLIGSLLAYWLGWWGQDVVVSKIIQKYGKYFLITEHEYDQSEKWFRKHGEFIVLASRVLPVIRTFISLPAGVARMKSNKFILYTIIGCFIWTAILTQLGVILGSNWKVLEVYFHKFDIVIVIVSILIISWYIWRKVKTLKQTSV